MKVLSINSKEFEKYGKVINEKSVVDNLIPAMENFSVPDVMNTYSPSEEILEKVSKEEFTKYFNKEIQVGYCNGRGNKLNSLEYHEDPEIDVAVNSLILLLATYNGQETIDSSTVEAFMMNKGDAVMLYAKTLHFAPIAIEKNGFKSVIVLPKGTNLPLENRKNGDMYFAVNKWLIAHPEHTKMVENGAYVGITGKNIGLEDLEY